MTILRVKRNLAHVGVAAAFAAATLLAVCLPAHAQRLSLAERVSRLEQQVQNRDQNGIGLVNQIQALKAQNQQLQGQVEELQHQLQQLQQSGKDQYVDLDSRLRKLESGGGASAPASAASSTSAAAPGSSTAAPAPAASGPRQAQAAPAAAGSAPAAAGSSAGPADDPQAAKAAYSTAFQALRNNDFVTSSREFRQFIQTYPHDALTPNAYYWLGESYYVTQNYKVALDTFQTLIAKFPDSDKTAGAMLKVGYCQDALNQSNQAVATLKAVMAKYPDSDVAHLAQSRLHDIQVQSVN